MPSNINNIDLSTEYTLWRILAQKGWTIPYEGLPLTPVSGTDVDGTTIPANSFTSVSTRHPWCFFDARVKNTDRSRITVRRNGVVISAGGYLVDYKHKRVTFPSITTGTLTVDVETFAVDVTDGYPTAEVLQTSDLPIIAYEMETITGKPFAVGTAASDWSYRMNIDILANDSGTRAGLVNDIMVQIVALPLLDMSEFKFLDSNEDYNPHFNFDTQFRGNLRVGPRNVVLLHPRRGGSDKERNRAFITFDVKNVE